jgi:hypothetical protein
MGSVGDCYDNAVAESFFATLKKDKIHRRSWPTKAELRTEVFSYIESFYNPERLQRRSATSRRRPSRSGPWRPERGREAPPRRPQNRLAPTGHGRLASPGLRSLARTLLPVQKFGRGLARAPAHPLAGRVA